MNKTFGLLAAMGDERFKSRVDLNARQEPKQLMRAHLGIVKLIVTYRKTLGFIAGRLKVWLRCGHLEVLYRLS